MGGEAGETQKCKQRTRLLGILYQPTENWAGKGKNLVKGGNRAWSGVHGHDHKRRSRGGWGRASSATGCVSFLIWASVQSGSSAPSRCSSRCLGSPGANKRKQDSNPCAPYPPIRKRRTRHLWAVTVTVMCVCDWPHPLGRLASAGCGLLILPSFPFLPSCAPSPFFSSCRRLISVTSQDTYILTPF